MFVANFLVAQGPTPTLECAPKGIFTNPSSPVNPHLPAKTNTFDWKASNYNLNWIFTSENFINSPFYQPDNVLINHFYETKDMKSEDGWELIYKSFGFTDAGVATDPKARNPRIVFYNKFTGMLRVFFARGDASNYTGIRMKMYFVDNSNMQTSLLDQSKPLIALDAPFVRGQFLDAFSPFSNTSQKWHYAEFMMQYDPCTCYYSSKLAITIYLLQEATISLEGTSNGEIVAMEGGSVKVNQEKSSKALGNVAEGFKKTGEFFKTVDSFVNGLKEDADGLAGVSTADKNAKKNALISFGGLLKDGSFLKAGLNAFPVVASALSLVDFFVGGGKKSGPQEVKLTPMSITSQYRFGGSINHQHWYDDIIFWNPGSTGAVAADSEYPYYNEVMGVFNLIKTPKLRKKTTLTWYEQHTRLEKKYEYRIPDDLQFVVNPASKLEIQDMQVSLIIEGDFYATNTIRGETWSFETYNAESQSYQYRSNPINVGCLKDRVFKVLANSITANGTEEWQPDGEKIFIKITINFKRTDDPDAQNVLYVAKYPVNVVTNEAIGTVSLQNPCTRTVAPQSSDAVKTFCTSATGVYKLSTRFNPIVEEDEDKAEDGNEIAVAVFPNPADAYFNVLLESQSEEEFELKLFNAFGIEVHQITTKGKQASISTDKLVQGFYYLHIYTKNGVIRKQVLIQK